MNIEREGPVWMEQSIDWPPVHQVSAHQSCEFEGAADRFLRILGPAQEQECDQGDGNLDADGVFRNSDEVLDFHGLFHPAKEQLDLPTSFVEVGDLLCWRIEIVGDDAKHFASL